MLASEERDVTIKKLIAKLQRMEVSERAPVVVDMTEFRLVSDDYTHWKIHDCKTETIRWSKDDSFELKDGTERTKEVVVIL